MENSSGANKRKLVALQGSPAPKKQKKAVDPKPLQECVDESTLHCVICMDFPLGEIYQCSNSHLLCSGCHHRILESDNCVCPTCRVKLSRDSPVRNRVAEHFLCNLTVSCSITGCSQKVKHGELDRHEKELCRYRMTKCKYFRLGCDWEGISKKLRKHQKICPTLQLGPKTILKRVNQRYKTFEQRQADADAELEFTQKVFNMISARSRAMSIHDVIIMKVIDHDLSSEFDEMCSPIFVAFREPWEVVLEVAPKYQTKSVASSDANGGSSAASAANGGGASSSSGGRSGGGSADPSTPSRGRSPSRGMSRRQRRDQRHMREFWHSLVSSGYPPYLAAGYPPPSPFYDPSSGMPPPMPYHGYPPHPGVPGALPPHMRGGYPPPYPAGPGSSPRSISPPRVAGSGGPRAHAPRSSGGSQNASASNASGRPGSSSSSSGSTVASSGSSRGQQNSQNSLGNPASSSASGNSSGDSSLSSSSSSRRNGGGSSGNNAASSSSSSSSSSNNAGQGQPQQSPSSGNSSSASSSATSSSSGSGNSRSAARSNNNAAAGGSGSGANSSSPAAASSVVPQRKAPPPEPKDYLVLKLRCNGSPRRKHRIEAIVFPGPQLGLKMKPVFIQGVFKPNRSHDFSLSVTLPITKSQGEDLMEQDTVNFRLVLIDKNPGLDRSFSTGLNASSGSTTDSDDEMNGPVFEISDDEDSAGDDDDEDMSGDDDDEDDTLSSNSDDDDDEGDDETDFSEIDADEYDSEEDSNSGSGSEDDEDEEDDDGEDEDDDEEDEDDDADDDDDNNVHVFMVQHE